MKNDDYYWNIIKNIGWEIKTTNIYEIPKFLVKDYGFNISFQLRAFYWKKLKEMKDHLRFYWLETREIIQSDDGYWDLCANIVGLGKEVFYAIKERPRIAISLSQMYAYTENFGYIFHDIKRWVRIKCELKKV